MKIKFTIEELEEVYTAEPAIFKCILNWIMQTSCKVPLSLPYGELTRELSNEESDPYSYMFFLKI